MKIRILDGDFTNDDAIEPVPGGIKYLGPNLKIAPTYCYAEVESIKFMDEKTNGTDGFSPLWGFIGQEAIGPAGLLLGVNRKKAEQYVVFICKLKYGSQFTAAVSASDWDDWREKMNQPFNPPAPNTFNFSPFHQLKTGTGWYIAGFALVAYLFFMYIFFQS